MRWRGRGAAVAVAVALAVAVATGGCSVSEPDAVRPDEAIHINPCDVMEREEAERAIGLPMGTERLQLITFDGTPTFYCQWLDGDDITGEYHVWSEFVVEPKRSTVEEHEEEADKSERVSGLGSLAWWWHEGSSAGLSVITPGGAWVSMSVVLPQGTTVATEHKDRLVELFRIVIPRVEEKLPGDAATLPPFPESPSDLCEIVPAAKREQILGWRGGRLAASHLGGHYGGHWRCSGGSEGRSFSFAMTFDPVAAADLAKVGAPVDGLARPARARPATRGDDGRIQSAAAVAFLAADGRLVVLELKDAALDDAASRQKLVELARAAIATTAGGA